MFDFAHQNFKDCQEFSFITAMEDGASNNELLLAASKNDQDETIEDILSEKGTYDINFTDGTGSTALHYAAKFGSLACLELLVDVEGVNLNIQTRIDGDTPLHKAVMYTDDPDVALQMVELLLEHDGDPKIQNRNKQTPLDLVDKTDTDMIKLLRRGIASHSVSSADIAKNDDDDDDDDNPSDEE